MKISEVEKILGIPKANIRFYEKEGLLSPARSENGYREYTEENIQQLKQIIILRKLGISVQQTSDILDGRLPLQKALDVNMEALHVEIARLNGSLALCRQLKQENAPVLDTDRYWDIIQEKELQGFSFQSLVEDYVRFLEPVAEWYLFPLPSGSRCWKQLVSYGVLCAVAMSVLNALAGRSFITSLPGNLLSIFIGWPVVYFLLGLLFSPLYLLRKHFPKLENSLWILFPVLMAVLMIVLVTWIYTV